MLPSDPLFDKGPLDTSGRDLRPDVASILASTVGTANLVHHQLGEVVMRSVWDASQVLQSCLSKVERAWDLLRSHAQAVHDAVGQRLEMDSSALLGAAWEIAQSQGCDVSQVIADAQKAPPRPSLWGSIPPVPVPTPPARPAFPGTGPPPGRPDPTAFASPGKPIPAGNPASPLDPSKAAPITAFGGYYPPYTNMPALLTNPDWQGIPAAPPAAPAAPVPASSSPTTVIAAPPPTGPPGKLWNVWKLASGANGYKAGECYGWPADLDPWTPGDTWIGSSAVWSEVLAKMAACPASTFTPTPLPPTLPPPPPPVGPPPPPPPTGPPPESYDVYNDSLGGPCYIQKHNEGPLKPGDPFIGTFATLKDAIAAAEKCVPMVAAEKCKPTKPFSIPSPPTFADLASCEKASADLEGSLSSSADWIANNVPEYVLDLKICVEDAALTWVGGLPKVVKPVAAFALVPVVAGLRSLHSLFTQTLGCNPAAMAIPVAAKILLGLFQKWAGSGFDKYISQLNREIDWICPEQIPTQNEVNDLFNQGRIEEVLWACWTRANNNLPGPQQMVRQQTRAQPGIGEIISAGFRGLMNDETVDDRLKLLGVKYPDDRRLFADLQRYIPGVQDLVRFMVRDVFDPDIVDAFQLDSQFDSKFAGRALEWAKANGVDASVFKYFWRAHWELPSATQAFEMYHRLRSGRVDEKLAVDEEDIRKLLEVNDLAPFWVDKLMAVSRPLLRLTDIRSAYNFGVMDDKELVEQYQDRGYSLDDATIQARATSIRKNDWFRARYWYKKWVAGTITDAQADAFATADGVTAADLPKIRKRVIVERRAVTTEKCTAALHKRYLIGDIYGVQAVPLLQNLGHDLDAANEFVERWNCELASRGKAVAAGELCIWAERGLISTAEYTARLIRLGYSTNDAGRVASVCASKISEKLAARQQHQQARQDRLKAKAEAAKQKAAMAAKKAAEKQGKVFVTAELVDEKAHRKWVSAAGKIARVGSHDEAALMSYVKQKVNELVKGHGYSLNGAVDLVATIASEIKASKESDYESVFNRVFSHLPGILTPDPAAGPPLR